MSDLDELVKTLTASRVLTFRRPRVSLHVVAGPEAGRKQEFDGRLRIGSRHLADFVLSDPKVSGLHCEISAGEELRVRDLGSKNGTFVGGYRVYDVVVPAGDSITVGDSRIQLAPTGHSVELPLHESTDFFGLVGRSAPMRALTAQIERAAASDATVLIQGESGTGKELVAEALHLAGRRASGPLVVADIGALHPNLAASELFGHERGAYTGAVESVAGAFERAHGGTLFLDEIGELSLDLQPTLLRALESHEVRRLGGQRNFTVDVRIVAASNRDLALAVQRGRFREDLYYRLAVIKLTVPPLRDRLDDVPLLAMHLLEQMGVDPATLLTVESMGALSEHDWPGNVRELRNTLERAALLMQPPMPDLPPAAIDEQGVDLREPLRVAKQRVIAELERVYVTTLLRETHGNITQAARRAGMDRMSIHRIVQRLRLRARPESKPK